MRTELNSLEDMVNRTVERVLASGNYYDESCIVLTFTDNTFICIKGEPKRNSYDPLVTIKQSDFDLDDCHLWISDIIDSGIMSESEVQEVIDKQQRVKDEYDYKQYIELKFRFEGKR